ncbi:Lrp/AsnC family transcriptional regulator [Candidatus Woesearchaeota archaeon]|nr:Lrp/AsnC family transcriptional regulator [Candidatus Woesearchaeota archaeon]MBT5342750.1 Lrp/AsnC family transcriptional regulator [Candidatus Woesearchaeota archaeon]MBT5740624.1 Lrp/AsnC family transcriptional regulator [Candidatus Woesearchaeota archaeon]
MVIKLNKRDQKLLKILDLDARQSNIQIAKKLKISKNVVNYNIKRLEDEKLIKGYNTLVNASKLGYFFFRVYVDFYERDINVDDELIKYLIDLPEAGLVARVVGEWDVLIGFYVEKVDDFQKVWNKVLEKFRKHVKHFNIALVTEQISFRRSYLTDEKKDISEKNWVIDEAEKVKVDDLDLNILKMLAKNARTPIKDIALKTKMGSMAIIYRIKQLINKKVIVGTRVSIEFSKLGYNHYRVNMELDDLKVINKLISFCQVHPNILKVDKAISEFDFEFDMEVKNFEQFQEIIDQMKIQFPGAIRDYNYFRVLKYYKGIYMPSK